MISITEIVLIIAGFAAIILGYLLPAGKEMDEEDKMLMEKEIRELVRREVEDQRDTIDDMVGDSVENSLDRTERAMERISNEKLSAIGEYSDTVINDIHKNHDEVMFMYDMLNDKHKNLTNVVSEVTRRADEARQAVRDAEVTAKEAQEASMNLRPAPHENVRAILLDETEDTLSGIRIPYTEKTQVARPSQPAPVQTPAPAPAPMPAASTQKRVSPAAANVVRPEPQPMPPRSGYVEERYIQELEIEDIPAEILSSEQLSGLHVIGGKAEKDTASAKVVPITEAVRVEGRSKNPDTNMRELTANDPVSQNKQIIEMHKAGKSNMVIARELGLGIGEVKLVIDLSNKHRKVR
ncbi:MAG: hypothetical protein IJU77_15130 [Butyrivibrio sp.]|nr:hypothetical protein [Butyrivibrio sp.]